MIENSALLTDLYEITMSEGYWKQGLQGAKACFYAHYRQNPFGGGYSIACGMEHLSHIIDEFEFTDSDIEYLGSIKANDGRPLFNKEFLKFLRGYKLTLDIDAPLEGTVMFAYEPLVRVTGPLIDCQLIEPILLNAINFETLIATKAARVCYAAQAPVAEFGLRRAQGPNGALRASRAAYIGGCASTSNVLCGQKFDIPVSGTHAHSWVMSFDSELEAFRAFAKAMPHNCILLVDTYDIPTGLKNAITVGKEMETSGEKLLGIRIDSGDLAWGTRLARKMLDEAGLGYVNVVATNDLDEYTIASLKSQNACIDSYGVGTKLACAYDQPALGGVYKMSALQKSPSDPWEYKIKLSGQQGKRTLPGVLDILRFCDSDGMYRADMIYDLSSDSPSKKICHPFDNALTKDVSGFESQQVLLPLVRDGKSVKTNYNCHDARNRVISEMKKIDKSCLRFLNPGIYPVGLDSNLLDMRDRLVAQHQQVDVI